MTKIEIINPKDYEAKQGEIYEINYRLGVGIGFIDRFLKDRIVKSLVSNPHYDILSVKTDPDNLFVTVRIVGTPLWLVITAVTSIIVASAIYMSLHKVHKIIQEPTGAIATIILTVAGFGVITLFLLKEIKTPKRLKRR